MRLKMHAWPLLAKICKELTERERETKEHLEY